MEPMIVDKSKLLRLVVKTYKLTTVTRDRTRPRAARTLAIKHDTKEVLNLDISIPGHLGQMNVL